MKPRDGIFVILVGVFWIVLAVASLLIGGVTVVEARGWEPLSFLAGTFVGGVFLIAGLLLTVAIAHDAGASFLSEWDRP